VKEQLILRVLTKQMFPFMLVFGFYIIAHGEPSPGGGFQGGVTLAAAFILYAMVLGRDEMHRIFPRRISDVLMAIGVLVYAGTGTYCLLAGSSTTRRWSLPTRAARSRGA
jgi:multicomponent Na+:H+ antiporter subunit B